MNTRFLRRIAEYYGTKDPATLANYTFVTPNKRSAMFLKRFVRDCLAANDRPVILPRFIPFGRLLTHFSEFGEAGRNELLFTLYEAMKEVDRGNGRVERENDFDSFVFWGDMMLSDFNEIDTSLVNASDIFRNIRKLKEIQSDFLDEDQKEIVRRLWGEGPLTRRTDSESPFWLHMSRDREGVGEGSLTENFKTLWDIQGSIYEKFHELLHKKQMGTSGLTARSAWKKIRSMSAEEFPYRTRYVFVGFAEPATVEALIMKRLHDIGIADFFWDIRDTELLLGPDGPHNKSIARISALSRELKAPEDFEPAPPPGKAPSVEVIASPSKIAQAKVLADILGEWVKSGYIDTSDAMNTAIVLPDESLLIPVLYSIPEEIESVNITMGVPYSTTTFAGLFRSIISMQLRARMVHGEQAFYFEDVNAVLSHPHIRLICGGKVDRILKTVADEHIYMVPSSVVAEVDEKLAESVFTFVPGSDSEAVASYLTRLIDWISEGLYDDSGKSDRDRLETKFLGYFRREVEEILSLAKETWVEMNERSFFVLLERVLSTAQIGVNGKPLQGLQVMGVLETRALDFDNVIILSMNEGTYPKKQYVKTMIPNSLRLDYGLPDLNAREGLYAYCFYRLLSRARRVKLVYDSRTGVRGAGEESRYIAQLKYLMPGLGVESNVLRLPASFCRGREIRIEKTPEVMAHLDAFIPGKGTLNLSASALKTYKSCPLHFYLSEVRKLRPDDEPVSYMTTAEYGSVFHRVFQNLFRPYEGKIVDSSVISGWIEDPGRKIVPLINDAVFEFRHPRLFRLGQPAPAMNAEETVMARGILKLVVRLLKEELLRFVPGTDVFRHIRGEYEVKGPWQITPGLTVNFRMYIDRVDETVPGSLRFIDYKTGTDLVEVDLGRLADRSYKKNCGAVFQLLTYCEAYRDLRGFDGPIQPMIYSVRNAFAGKALDPITYGVSQEGSKRNKTMEPLLDYREVSSVFRPQLEHVVSEIFDPSVPFTQCDDDSGCRFCPFTDLCARSPRQY